MSDENKQSGTLDDDAESFDTRVNEISEEDSAEDTAETDYGLLSEENAGINSSEKSANDSTDGWLYVSIAFVAFGIIGAIANPEDPLFAFFVVGAVAGTVVWLYATPSGEQFREEAAKQQQQQQQDTISTSKSETKRACPNCGWQNPTRNNYCHDCGKEIN